MLNRLKYLLQANVAAITICVPAFAQIGNVPNGARPLDSDVILYHRPPPAISPDGEWVAYISKGYVSVCRIADPQPLQLFEVPNSWTHVLTRPEYLHARGDVDHVYRILGREGYDELQDKATDSIWGLDWTHQSDGVIVGVQSYAAGPKNPTYNNRLVSLIGRLEKLSQVGPETKTSAISAAVLTRDRKFLVGRGYERALIWDVAANRPRATPFLYLTPSPTSGRWIGIEKDTRQLVITNEAFEVIKRFTVFRPARSWGFKLDWSPDESFIIWRNQIGFDHYNDWEGFWMEIETGIKRELAGQFMDETIGFTGRGGEFYRCGQNGVRSNRFTGSEITGAHLTIVPEGDGLPIDLWRIHVDRSKPMPGALTNRPGNPPIRMGRNGELFAIGLPRPAGERSGWIWHLIDRNGDKWRFPGDDNGKFITPYEVVGFAEGNKTIVAHDDKQLFSLPVATIKVPENKVE